MPLDLTTLSALAAPSAREIFKQIVNRRTVRFNDLVQLAGGREPAKQAIKLLIGASLVKEESSGLEDFNTYYVTAQGLEASRQAGI